MSRGTPQERAKRNQRIAALRRAGKTQREIAAEVGLTTGTVLRILADTPGLPQAQDLRAARTMKRTSAQHQEAKVRLREHLATTTGRLRPTELAEAVGVTVTVLRTLLTETQRRRLVPHEPGPRRRALQETSDEVLLDFARLLAESGPVTTERWDTERDRVHIASSGIVGSRFGGWLRFLAKAGVPHTIAPTGEWQRFTDEDLLAAVATFLARPHGDGLESTTDQWTSYAEGNPRAPGLYTLRHRIGGWDEVKSRALEHRAAQRAASRHA